MWIEHVPVDRAEGELAKIYRRLLAGGRDEIENIILAHSLNPAALKALMTFYQGVMHGDCALTMKQREMIAVTVSQVNECHY
jgi:alkylhydroperoxidase family enzyme